eukprot:3194364-Amphidinium_carterae.1
MKGFVFTSYKGCVYAVQYKQVQCVKGLCQKGVHRVVGTTSARALLEAQTSEVGVFGHPGAHPQSELGRGAHPPGCSS